MANPRQRRKAKSSTHRPVSHSKRAKRLQKKMPAIRGPKALQEAWDRSKTLRQNYLALGLQHDLNPVPSGGSEVCLNRTVDQTNTIPSLPAGPEAATSSSVLPKGFGRIIRDASGNVVRVELPEEEEQERETLIDTTVPLTNPELQTWTQDRAESCQGASTLVRGQFPIASRNLFDLRGHSVAEGIDAVAVMSPSPLLCKNVQQLTDGPVDLENLAASATVRERYTSLGERSCLERLVKKYGDDVGKMARDRRLNPDQRTANELRKAIARAGGHGALCKSAALGGTG